MSCEGTHCILCTPVYYMYYLSLHVAKGIPSAWSGFLKKSVGVLVRKSGSYYFYPCSSNYPNQTQLAE